MYDANFFEQYTSAPGALDGKVIVVTGAGSGIGRCAAIAYAELGATVVLLGRNLHNLEAVYDEIEAAKLPQPAIFPLNLESATEHDIDAMKDSIATEFGCLDGLLHNACELGPRTPLANYPLAEWQKLILVNLTTPFLITKALLPMLGKSEAASIVFTSSSVARQGRAYWGAYAITKAANENLVETLADELEGSSAIRVNSINPGATRTRMRATAYPAEDPQTVTAPKDIMKPYIFLMSNDSKGLNGQHVDAQAK